MQSIYPAQTAVIKLEVFCNISNQLLHSQKNVVSAAAVYNEHSHIVTSRESQKSFLKKNRLKLTTIDTRQSVVLVVVIVCLSENVQKYFAVLLTSSAWLA